MEYLDRLKLERHFDPCMSGKNAYTASEVLLFIQTMKAEDAKPAVHAHWMPMESQLHVEKSGACANCGEAWPISDTEYFYYCPNCGAIMDEQPNKT